MNLYRKGMFRMASLMKSVAAGFCLWQGSLTKGYAVNLSPCAANGYPLQSVTIALDGKPVNMWQTSEKEAALVFKPVDGTIIPSLPSSSYLEITYLDRGYGRLEVTYKGADGQWHKPDKFTQVVLLDTGRQESSCQRCSEKLAGVPEIRIGLAGENTKPLAIAQVSLAREPPTDPHFRYLLGEDWRHPYEGKSQSECHANTLRGKIMVGYQGWFRTPNDPYDTGWRHWGDIAHGLFSVDMWPDVSQYPAQTLDKANDVRTLSGKPGLLFSSAWPEVAELHFALMRQHGIDGAFVQRFVSRGNLHALGGGPEWVLDNARDAANHQGRLWAIEYDVSGCPDSELLADIKGDWTWLVDQFGIRQDPAYAHEGNRPVVFVWGMAVPDRHISPETADAVVGFLKNDAIYGGNYVIGGLPGQWRTLSSSWQRHIGHYDGALVWQSQNYARDLEDFRRLGIDDYPHVWPGFSWANLKHLPSDSTIAFTPREGGGYYEGLLAAAIHAGTDRLFVGMFDEYDEGTAILPMSDDPPPTPARPGVNLKFLANDDAERPVNILVPNIDLPLNSQPPLKGIPAADFNVRFDGQIIPPSSGRYTLQVDGLEGDKGDLTADGAQFRVNHFGEATSPALSLVLTAGKPATFHLDYQHGRSTGRARLLWEGPQLEQQVIPPSAYLDAWGRFLNNEGHPSDWWLVLTDKWKDELTKQLAIPSAEDVHQQH